MGEKTITFFLSLLVAVFSSLFAVWVTTRAQRRSEKLKHEQARMDTFSLLHMELCDHKQTFSDLEPRLDNNLNLILPAFDSYSYSVKSFLQSDYTDVEKDFDLFVQLQRYLLNIDMLNSLIGRGSMAAALRQTDYSNALEGTIKKITNSLIKNVEDCLTEIGNSKVLSPTDQEKRIAHYSVKNTPPTDQNLQ